MPVCLVDVLVPLRPTFPVVEEALKHDLAATIPRLECVGTGAGVLIGGDLQPVRAPIAVLFVSDDRVLIYDEQPRKRGKERGVGLVQMEGDGIGGVDRYFGDESGPQPGITVLQSQHPIHGVFDVLGGQFRAIVELHALSQVERIRQSVGTDRPALGQLGLDFTR